MTEKKLLPTQPWTLAPGIHNVSYSSGFSFHLSTKIGLAKFTSDHHVARTNGHSSLLFLLELLATLDTNYSPLPSFLKYFLLFVILHFLLSHRLLFLSFLYLLSHLEMPSECCWSVFFRQGPRALLLSVSLQSSPLNHFSSFKYHLYWGYFVSDYLQHRPLWNTTLTPTTFLTHPLSCLTGISHLTRPKANSSPSS